MCWHSTSCAFFSNLDEQNLDQVTVLGRKKPSLSHTLSHDQTPLLIYALPPIEGISKVINGKKNKKNTEISSECGGQNLGSDYFKMSPFLLIHPQMIHPSSCQIGQELPSGVRRLDRVTVKSTTAVVFCWNTMKCQASFSTQIVCKRFITQTPQHWQMKQFIHAFAHSPGFSSLIYKLWYWIEILKNCWNEKCA